MTPSTSRLFGHTALAPKPPFRSLFTVVLPFFPSRKDVPPPQHPAAKIGPPAIFLRGVPYRSAPAW